MKREKGDLLVGMVVTAAAVMVLAAALWIVPAWTDRTYPLYAEFKNVDGIGDRSPVQLQGYRVGYVDAIDPRVTDDGTLVFRVRMEIDKSLAEQNDFELPQGTIALLTPPPLPIGSGSVVLELPERRNAPVMAGATLEGRRASVALDQFQNMATNLEGELTETFASARVLMDSLTRTASSVNRTVASTQAALPPLLEGLQMELAAAESLTVDMRRNINTLTPAAVAGIDSATALLADSRVAVERVNGLLETSGGDITAILASLDSTSVMVQSLVNQFSDRPLWFLFTGAKEPR